MKSWLYLFQGQGYVKVLLKKLSFCWVMLRIFLVLRCLVRDCCISMLSVMCWLLCVYFLLIWIQGLVVIVVMQFEIGSVGVKVICCMLMLRFRWVGDWFESICYLDGVLMMKVYLVFILGCLKYVIMCCELVGLYCVYRQVCLFVGLWKWCSFLLEWLYVFMVLMCIMFDVVRFVSVM